MNSQTKVNTVPKAAISLFIILFIRMDFTFVGPLWSSIKLRQFSSTILKVSVSVNRHESYKLNGDNWSPGRYKLYFRKWLLTMLNKQSILIRTIIGQLYTHIFAVIVLKDLYNQRREEFEFLLYIIALDCKHQFRQVRLRILVAKFHQWDLYQCYFHNALRTQNILWGQNLYHNF